MRHAVRSKIQVVAVVAVGALVLVAPLAQAGPSTTASVSPPGGQDGAGAAARVQCPRSFGRGDEQLGALVCRTDSAQWRSPAPSPPTDQAADSSPAAPAPRFMQMACPVDVFPATMHVDCGYVRVPENRGKPLGRSITVAAAVIHAANGHPNDDPIMFLDGGPSFGAINTFAVNYYFGGASYTDNRDVVLVDTRGTGLSQPRPECPEFDQADQTSFYAKPYVYARDVAVASFSTATLACRDRLRATGIDLASYNTAESAADLDALRHALGYRTWNIIGLSADGGLALTYMRLFPAGIRSAIIDSGQSTQMLSGLDYARGVNVELDRIFAGCAANPACNAAYPNLRKLFYTLIQQLQAHPAIVTVPLFPGGPVTFKEDGAQLFADTFNTIFPGNIYAPDQIKPLLATLWRVTHGELAQVIREASSGGDPPVFDFYGTSAIAKTMSYVCHDQIAFLTQADLRQAARDVPALAPKFLDPAFDLPSGLPVSPAGCRLWDVGRADPVQHQPVSSPIPTLVLTGEFDIGVPDYIVRQIPPTLPNSYFYLLPASPHVQLANYNNDSGCARSIAGQFLDQPRRRPDSSCIASIPPYDYTP